VADPVCAFLGDGTLCEFIAESDLEIGAIEAGFCVPYGNEELSTFLPNLVTGFGRREGRRSKDKLQFLDVFKFLPKRFEREN